jgi:hypothetical protein
VEAGRQILGGRLGEGWEWGAAGSSEGFDEKNCGGEVGIGRGMYMGLGLYEKADHALMKTSSKWRGVSSEWGWSTLRLSRWNPHQNAVSRLSLDR